MSSLSVLDRFLDAALHAFNLAENGGNKSQHDRANELLIANEREFLATIGLNTLDQDDSDAFDRILELVEAYRKDESQYQALEDYVESVRKK
jgi:hypothetical protein